MRRAFFLTNKNKMYYTKNTIVFLDGKWINAQEAKTSLYDQTLHYGNGVFEGIRSYKTENGTHIFKAEEHFERLLESAKKMHIYMDYSVSELVKISYELLEKNNLSNAYLRPLISLTPNMTLTSNSKPKVFICAWKWEKYLGEKPLNIMTSSYRRPHPKSCHVEAKTVGHYTNSILATTEAKAKGYDEALLLDVNDNVAEGPGANFFFEKNKILFTCPLGNILPGITRATVFEMAKELEIKVVEKHFTIEELAKADSAFFTGTAAEIAPIGSLDKNAFPLVWNESLGYELSRLYQKKVTNQDYYHFELV